MRNVKKLVATLMAATVIFTSCVPAYATEVTDSNVQVSETILETEDVQSAEETETTEDVQFEEETIESTFADIEVTTATPTMKIYAIYLGGNPGDAVLLESNGEYILMDIGDSTAGKKKGSYASVKALLDKLGVKKLSLYYSHFHGDHTGGVGTDGALDWLTSEYNVTTIYVPDSSIFLGKVDISDTYEKI